MFSFEGHYRQPRVINYSKQKDVGKKDLIENARSEREKRALLNRQITCASTIQKAFRHYLIKKTNKVQASIEFQKLISEISCNNTDDSNIHILIFSSINYLLKFFKNSDCDGSLKSVVNVIISKEIIGNIFKNLVLYNYYHAIDLGLLLRITARHIKSFPENSSSLSYNLFLRFFEIMFFQLDLFHKSQFSTSSFHKTILQLLLNSKYFSDMSAFIDKQILFKNEFTADIYNQIKVKSILKIVLTPIEKVMTHDLCKIAIIQYINTIYSSPSNHFNYPLAVMKIMNIAVLDIVPLNIFINIIFQSLFFPVPSLHLNVSSELLLLILSSVVDIKIDVISPEISAKALLLFFKISRALFDSQQLVLSSKLPEYVNQNFLIGNRDDFDFEMKEIELNEDYSQDDDEDELEDRKSSNVLPKEMSAIEQEIAMILKMKFCLTILPQAIQADDSVVDKKILYDSIGYLYYLLILETKIIGSSESKTFILNLIQTSKTVSRQLWTSIIEKKTKDTNKSLIQSLINGQIRLIDNDIKEFFGKLLCFANCLHWRLLSVQDLDLIKIDSEGSSKIIEFSPNELCDIVLNLRDIMYGLILLIYDSKSSCSSFTTITPTSSAMTVFNSQLISNQKNSQMCNETLVKMFIELQRVVIRLYNRDVRKGLKVSGKRLDWVKPEICRINVNQLSNSRYLLEDYKFGTMMCNQLTSSDLRQIVILKEMPFIVPIGTRMKLFKELIHNMTASPLSSTSAALFYARSPIRVRRDYLYEDAFNLISRKTLPNLRSNLKIEFVDRFGMSEPGVDGGGLLREFLTNIIKEACDPKRGLFVSTSNNLLYPNPELETLYPDNWKQHLDFFGRMLGLMIFKGLLVEAQFAPFFIQKLFNNRSSREEIDIDNLQYLDEDLYRNLLSLKSMSTVEDINLDFTVSRSCYGMSKIVELKPNGEYIPVTNNNKIEYIYLVADYKLNRQISNQTSVIIAGLNDVFPIECFQLFDLDEISFIITGGGSSIDLTDLKRNTIYHGVDDPDNSEIIRNFWLVLFQMSEEEKRNFIQFVTSISRAPMLGFSDLTPKFAIQIVNDTDRLPTASTCINLLKLPAYENIEEMRQKLLYAIGSDSGFHLS